MLNWSQNYLMLCFYSATHSLISLQNIRCQLQLAWKFSHGYDIDAPHNTQIKERVCENAVSESAYNDSHNSKK